MASVQAHAICMPSSESPFSQSSAQMDLPSSSSSVCSVGNAFEFRYSQHRIINLDDCSFSDWIGASIATPSPAIALPVKLPHFLPAGVNTSTRFLPLSAMWREHSAASKSVSEEELVNIAVQLLDAVAACELYGRMIGKEFAGGFLTRDTVMTDEQEANYYIVGCRYGADKNSHAHILGRGGLLESLHIPPWGIPSAPILRQGATTRGAFAAVPSSVSLWSLAILLCECVILRPLPVPKNLQQPGVYRSTSPATIANMAVNLVRSKGYSEGFGDFIRSLMMSMARDISKPMPYLQDPIVYQHIRKWRHEGTHTNVVERYSSCYEAGNQGTSQGEESQSGSSAQSPRF